MVDCTVEVQVRDRQLFCWCCLYGCGLLPLGCFDWVLGVYGYNSLQMGEFCIVAAASYDSSIILVIEGNIEFLVQSDRYAGLRICPLTHSFSLGCDVPGSSVIDVNEMEKVLLQPSISILQFPVSVIEARSPVERSRQKGVQDEGPCRKSLQYRALRQRQLVRSFGLMISPNCRGGEGFENLEQRELRASCNGILALGSARLVYSNALWVSRYLKPHRAVSPTTDDSVAVPSWSDSMPCPGLGLLT